MSRPTRSWFRLAVPAMLVIASIVGGLGPVPGASGQAAATTTPTAVVATTPVMAVASGTVTVTVTIPMIEATVVATPTRVPSGGLPTGTATVVAIGTVAVATATLAISVGGIEPPMAATPTLVQAGGLPPWTATVVASGTMAVATATLAISVGAIEPPVDASGHPGMPVGIGARAKPPQPGPVGMAAASPHPASMGESAARFMDVATGPFTALAAGYAHTCGLAYGGIAYCWGFNGNGELGDGTAETPRTAPVAVNGGHFFTSIVAGYYHTCGLAQGGRTYCWGNNGNGQLGDGTTGQQSTPVMVSGGLAFESLASGQGHTCGLASDGQAYCWGYNGHGQIGAGTSQLQKVPVAVSGGTTFTNLVAGDNHTCGLAAGGKAYCWGSNWYGQLGDGTAIDRMIPMAVSGGITFTSLVAGYNHTCGLAWGGKAYCWGANFFGQLGDGTSGTNRSAPVASAGWPSFTSLAAGQSHTCGLLPTGTAYCWGSDQQGALGDGNAADRRPYPATVSGGEFYKTITAGQYHSCGLSLGGTAFCWGYNASGQLGDGTTTDHATPAAVNGGPTLTSLTAGGYHTCALAWDQTAFCWGLNDNAGLGDGSTVIRLSPVPVRGGHSFTALAAGGRHTCGLVADGTAYCWGWNNFGQIGDGTTADRVAPVAVRGGIEFTRLAVGYRHSCGLTHDGKAYCWGRNANGQLGDGTTTDHATPVAVSGGLAFTRLEAGHSHTCGLVSGGNAYCWGWNANGQLGDATTVDRTKPVAVSGGQTFIHIAPGSYHTCALATSGATFCWGFNGQGQLGDGTTTTRTSPVTVSGGFAFTSLVSGSLHACGLVEGGASYCWGYNGAAQLGDGSSTDRTTPVAVTGGRTFTSLVAGELQTCGLGSGGTAYCWGFGGGLLGDDTRSGLIMSPAAVSVWSVPAASTAPAPTIRDVRVVNMSDTAFNVSWVTDMDATGVIRWGSADDIGAPYTVGYDNRGATALQTVHFFSISGLAPSTRYRFDVVSGARTDTNQGAHYPVMTGPTLDTSAPDPVSGSISTRDGGVPTSVVLQVSATGPSGTSAPLSSLITSADQKSWGLNLGNLRTVALNAPFPVTAFTPVTVTADGGPDGTASITTTVAVLRAGTLALALTGDVSQTLQAGWNLVALRASPATPISASAVCNTLNMGTAGTAVELVRWVSGGWEGHRCGLPVNDFSLIPGSGYFIRLTWPETWTYRGAVITTPSTLALESGWNLVGATAISGTLSVASATCSQLNTVQAGTAVELDRWIDGGWDGHRCDVPANDFTQIAGQGYFVRLNRPARFAPSGVGFTAAVGNEAPSSGEISVKEGQAVTFTITVAGTTVAPGSAIYWVMRETSGASEYASDFTDTTLGGSYTVSAGLIDTVTRTWANDLATEGPETWVMDVRTGSPTGPLIGNSAIVTVDDTSVAPTATIAVTRASINEGDLVTYAIITAGVVDTYPSLYWTMRTIGAGTTLPSDFTDRILSGTFPVDPARRIPPLHEFRPPDGTLPGTFPVTSTPDSQDVTRTWANDLTTEGPETWVMDVRTGSTAGPVIGTSAIVTVADTSPAPVATITRNTPFTDEGASATFSIIVSGTTGAPGSTLYWAMRETSGGTKATPSDFTDNTLGGSYIVSAGLVHTVTRIWANDLTVEGPETWVMEIRTGSTTGPVIGTSAIVTVADTSQVPSATVSPSGDTISEGGIKSYTITTRNVSQGIPVYWIFRATQGTLNTGNLDTGDQGDFLGKQYSGYYECAANGVHTVTVGWRNDLATEGTEAYVVDIKLGSTNGVVIGTGGSTTVLDTSHP